MKNSIRTVGNIFFIIFFSKLLGQAREMMVASSFGTGGVADSFIAATQIPLNFFDLILGAAIVSTFVPVFNEYLEKDGVKRANDFSNNFVGVITVLSVVISVLGVLFSGTVVGIMTSFENAETSILASKLLKIMFPSMILTAIAYSYAGVLQSFGQFNAPAAMSVVSNAVSIGYLLVFKNRFGITGLAVSMLVGWIMQLVLLIPFLVKHKYKFGFKVNFAEAGMIKVYKLALPILLSSWVQPINVMFNTKLASLMDRGVSVINYSNKLYLIIASVFTVAVTNMILPELSRLYASEGKEEAGKVIGNSLKATSLFILPVMALFIVFSVPIVRIIYENGKFDETSVQLTSSALMCYSIGMVGYAWQEVLNKSFYSMQESKIPLQTAIIAIIINVIVSLSLFKFAGVSGLAIAAAVSATCSGIILFVRMGKTNTFLPHKEVVGVLVKGVVAATISAIVAKLLYCAIVPTDASKFILLLCVGGVCILAIIMYVLLLLLLRCKEVTELKSLIAKKKGANNE